ncbi:MAG: MarR family transcriptional regulator [Akkermansia sp.]|nr:MarR family transcriptional regulator [Akkermansia sp.]
MSTAHNSASSSIFFTLFQLMDDIRRDSLKKTPQTQQKRVMGLTMRQAGALVNVEILTRNTPKGIALKTLAQNLQMTVPATSLLVENMVNKGFLERTPNPEDRRAVCIRLSADGAEFIESTRKYIAMEIEKHSAVFNAEELTTLGLLVEKLVAAYYGAQEK